MIQGSVVVVFKSVVCILEGWSLCEAISHAVATRGQWEEDEDAPAVSYQKWRLGEQRKITDVALLGEYNTITSDVFLEVWNLSTHVTFFFDVVTAMNSLSLSLSLSLFLPPSLLPSLPLFPPSPLPSSLSAHSV